MIKYKTRHKTVIALTEGCNQCVPTSLICLCLRLKQLLTDILYVALAILHIYALLFVKGMFY